MSDHERYGQRDMLFSRWHRSLDKRYKFLDIDWIEFCHVCSEPLAVVEIAQDVGQDWKPTTVLEKLAKRSGLPAFCILYQTNNDKGLTGARVRRVFPKPTDFSQRSIEQLEKLVERVHSRCCAAKHDGERHEAIQTKEEVFDLARHKMSAEENQLAKESVSFMQEHYDESKSTFDDWPKGGSA